MIAPVLVLLLAAAAAAGPLFPIREGRKFGFIDRQGKVVIAPRFDAVGEECEGRIRVTVGSLSGYADADGKVVIEPQWDVAGDFRDGRAVVMKDGKYGLIDAAGKRIADIPFRVLGEFHQGLLRVQATGRTDANGKRLPTLYGFVDRQGKTAIEPQFMPAGEFSDDPANLAFGGLNHDWCYFDRTGRIVIRVPMGEHLNPANLFANGRLRVKDGFTWGFKDAAGNWAIAPKFNDAQDFKDGLARVQQGDKWVTIDTSGNTVAEDKRKVRPIEPFSEGLALAADNDLLGWVDTRGKLAFPVRKYDEAHRFSGGRARIKSDGLYGFLDTSGKLVIPCQFYGAKDFDRGLAFVMTREGSAYIDVNGKTVWSSTAR